jgi:hypothetical protein
MSALSDAAVGEAAPPLMKDPLPHSTIAKALGCSRQHVTSLVKKGMSTDSVESALGWYRYNVRARRPRLWIKPRAVALAADAPSYTAATDLEAADDWEEDTENILSTLACYDDNGQDINVLLYDPGVEFAAKWEEVEKTPVPCEATTNIEAVGEEGGDGAADRELTADELIGIFKVLRHDAAQRVYALPARLDAMVKGRLDDQSRALVRVALEVLRDRFFDAQGYPPNFIPWEERKAGEIVEFVSPTDPNVVTRRVVPVRRHRA